MSTEEIRADIDRLFAGPSSRDELLHDMLDIAEHATRYADVLEGDYDEPDDYDFGDCGNCG